MVRLKDIALKAGVSVMTVSKVLRDAPDISAATKARVRQLAQQMEYVPDTLAQGLRTRSTRLFGLVISSLNNPAYLRVAEAIEERATDLGYEVLLAHSQNDPQREETAIRRLLARRVEGIFIAPVYRLGGSASAYNEIKQRGTPAVLLGHAAPFCDGFTSIATDEASGSQELTRHLIELGHRRIVFLAGPPAAPSAQERLDGYRRALRDANLELDDSLVFTAGTSIEDGQKAALQLVQEAPKATALQCFNDLVAIGAGEILLKQGMRIPEDISLAGFGNTPFAEFYRIPLTTVRQPKNRLGLAAVEAMRKLLNDEPAEALRLSTELLVRASTAAVPQRAL